MNKKCRHLSYKIYFSLFLICFFKIMTPEGSLKAQNLIEASEAEITLSNNAENFGHSVTGVVDFNNDGYSDVLVGAYSADGNGNSSGISYIYYGKEINGKINLNEADPDLVISGLNDWDYFGENVADIGYFNSDDFSDVAILASHVLVGGVKNSLLYLFFGKNLQVGTNLNAMDADVIILGGPPTESFGSFENSIVNAGDINNDGYDDLIVGAPYNSDNGTSSGIAYIFLGKSSFSSNLIDRYAADLIIRGDDSGDRFGYSASTIGDFNRDGYDDFIIIAQTDDGGGSASLFYGRDISTGTQLNASAADVKFISGYTNQVAGKGDINGDNRLDILLSSGYKKKAYIFYGKDIPSGTIIDCNSADLIIKGDDISGNLGGPNSIAELNGDRFDDIILASSTDETRGMNEGDVYIYDGALYIVNGRDWPVGSTINLLDADLKILGEDEGKRFGATLGSISDFN